MTDDTLLRDVAERGVNAVERSQLERFDWLSSALEVFVSEGIDAVRITRLAEELEVTRGSFYWHFANRDELVDTLVTYWRDKNTAAIVNAVQDASSLSDGIFRFFEACLDGRQFDPRLDLAIREWARRSSSIRSQMDAADNTRIETLCEFFRRCDYAMPEALIRARVIYFAQIGFYALDVKEPMATRLGYIEAYFLAFTGQHVNAQAAEAFAARVMERYGGDRS